MCNPLALAGTALVKGAMGAKAARKQAKRDRQTARENAAANNAAIGEFQRNDPFLGMMADGGITSQMRGLMGLDGADPTETLRKTPGYDFAFKQGMSALEHSLGANNALYSGKAMKEIVGYGQGMADQLFQQTFNNRMSIMGGAQDANRVVLGAKTGTNDNLANNMINASQTRANATQSLIDGISGAAEQLSSKEGAAQIAKIFGKGTI